MNIVRQGFLVHLGGEYYGATWKLMTQDTDDICETIRKQSQFYRDEYEEDNW